MMQFIKAGLPWPLWRKIRLAGIFSQDSQWKDYKYQDTSGRSMRCHMEGIGTCFKSVFARCC